MPPATRSKKTAKKHRRAPRQKVPPKQRLKSIIVRPEPSGSSEVQLVEPTLQSVLQQQQKHQQQLDSLLAVMRTQLPQAVRPLSPSSNLQIQLGDDFGRIVHQVDSVNKADGGKRKRRRNRGEKSGSSSSEQDSDSNSSPERSAAPQRHGDRPEMLGRLGPPVLQPSTSDYSVHQLPSIPDKKLRKKLLDLEEYVDFDLLLRRNRVEKPKKLQSNLSFVDGKMTLTPEDGKVRIDSFEAWAGAFSVFASYRITVAPMLSAKFFKYLAIIASYAERDVPTANWLEYDRQFRAFITSHPREYDLWAHQHEDTYIDCIQNPLRNTRVEPTDNIRRVKEQKKDDECRNCGMAGHFISSCPLPRKGQPGYGQPIQNVAAAEGEVCRNFNFGSCTTPCKAHRIHTCFRCGDSSHRAVNCTKTDP